MQYAFACVYHIPEPSRPVGALTFGWTAHAAFEAFTKLRREAGPRRRAADEGGPRAAVPRPVDAAAFGDRSTEQAYDRRVDTLLDNFWEGEVAGLGEALHEELSFELVIEDPAGGPPVVVTG